jgi:hypothetical protein
VSGLERVVERARGALEVPYPAKARILEELASDAESLYAHFRRMGHDEASATREVEARLAVTSHAARELATLHRSLYSRLVDRYAAGRQAAVEIGLLLVTVAGLLAAGVMAMLRMQLLGGAFLPWVVLLASAGAWLSAGACSFRIMIRGETRIERMRRGLVSIPALSLVAGTAAALSALYRLYSTLPSAWVDADHVTAVFVPWIRYSADLLSAALATGLGTGIVWFLLQTRIAAAERVERRLQSGLAWTVTTTGERK